MKRTNLLVLITLFASVFIINSCQSNREKTASVQAGNIEYKTHVKIERFEKDLFSINPDSVKEAIPMLQAKYGEFFEIFNYVLKLGTPKDPRYAETLKKFITDYFENLAYNKVMEIYPRLDDLTEDLNKAFTVYKEYFPEKRIPRVYTWVSGWNQSVVTSDTILGIGLDLFLGKDCEYYSNLGLAKYIRHTLQKEYIVPECIKTLGNTEFEFKGSENNVLANLLYKAKIWYFAKKILPGTPDTLLFGFTPDQLKWCNKNKEQMWTYLIEHKMLYSTDLMTIKKLIDPAPFTLYFTKESPGCATVWLGYKIIEAYMKNNPNITLPQLMQEKDYQAILRKSNFKP
jgi:hypothetical protein